MNWNGAGTEEGDKRREREREREREKLVVTNPIRCAGAAEEPLFSNTKMEGSRATSQKVKEKGNEEENNDTGNGSIVEYGRMNENSEGKKKKEKRKKRKNVAVPPRARLTVSIHGTAKESRGKKTQSGTDNSRRDLAWTEWERVGKDEEWKRGSARERGREREREREKQRMRGGGRDKRRERRTDSQSVSKKEETNTERKESEKGERETEKGKKMKR